MTNRRFSKFYLLALASSLAIAAATVPSSEAQYTDLHDFDTPTLASPQYAGILAQGRDGNLYGTAPSGGSSGRGGVFRVAPVGTYSVLYNFDNTHGSNPYSGLTLDSAGNFVGTAYNGGTALFGTVFKLTPGGAVTVLHNFVPAEGAGSYAPPLQGTDGNLYGVTSTEGIGFGSVYEITAAGSFSVLYQFDGIHGSTPIAPLIQATDGAFYGTTKLGGSFGFGTVFKITAGGVLTVLYNFDSTHGAEPYAPLFQASDGNFYGTARSGGTLNNGGVAFKLTPSKQLTVLHNFDQSGSNGDGTLPYAGLVQASDGSLYGVTSAGGSSGAGTLYRITASGVYSKLYDFDLTTGSLPFATLRQHTNGPLYGEATAGGATGHGALFMFAIPASLKPFVSLQPASGKVATTVGIFGGALTGTTSVKFNGLSASFSVLSDTYITATVPPRATTGFVDVVGPGGSLKSDRKFRVTPVILTIAPTSGSVGTTVVVTGNSLTQTTKVTFGGVLATSFTVNSDTKVTVTVPAGARSGKVGITTLGGTAMSLTSFTVTPSR
ncbi:MAG: IPT/TIG domain-containing protein [Acidobacteriales bacterium]|nr:IPT/TIG domain-containing protein [Terriglobales bacterium]